MSEKLKIIALISGGGRTVINILDAIEAGKINAGIDLVISSRSDARGLERAQERGLETAVVPSKDYRTGGKPDWETMSRAIDEIILPRNPGLVICAGFMCLYLFPPQLQGKVMNIHPALLPAFGGKGMWGHHVHEAVVASGVKVSGCTIHFTDNQYDSGPIILQQTCPVYDTDTPDDVAKRVFAEECTAYPEAVRLFAEGRLVLDGRIVKIKPEKN
ncbi:MAG: phosphoribosylglycinamide formyltransferase [Planctomycetes bacterium]|nr:phosphoribosylglycinamide formyltransferase [Planctomycetota bacterium]